MNKEDMLNYLWECLNNAKEQEDYEAQMEIKSDMNKIYITTEV